MTMDMERRGVEAPRAEAAEQPARRAGLVAELPSALLSATLLVATALLLRSCLLAGPIIDMRL